MKIIENWDNDSNITWHYKITYTHSSFGAFCLHSSAHNTTIGKHFGFVYFAKSTENQK